MSLLLDSTNQRRRWRTLAPKLRTCARKLQPYKSNWLSLRTSSMNQSVTTPNSSRSMSLWSKPTAKSKSDTSPSRLKSKICVREKLSCLGRRSFKRKSVRSYRMRFNRKWFLGRSLKIQPWNWQHSWSKSPVRNKNWPKNIKIIL